MVTRSRDGTRKPKAWLTTRYPLPQAYAASLSDSAIEPTCFSQAKLFPEWRAAMVDEFNALLKNGTWTLVPHRSDMNIVGIASYFM